MRPTIDADNTELATVLELLLADDLTITVREVSRKHSLLKNASAFTRSPTRMALIGAAQQRQRDARHVRVGAVLEKTGTAAMALAGKKAKVEELERQVQSLVVSHAACIKAVINHGGLGSLERFWAEYREIGTSIRALGAIPARDNVVHLAPAT